MRPCFTCKEGTHKPSAFAANEWTTCTACGARALNDAQLHDVKAIIEHNGQALIGACLGSRKTGTAAAAANEYGKTWLVVCPNTTIEQWVEAFQEWAPSAEIHVINAKNKTGWIDLKEAKDKFTVHIVNWERFRLQDLSKFRHIEGTILDEVHRMAGFGTSSARAAWRTDSVRRLGLSGTPANNKLPGLYNVCKWIWHSGKRAAERYRRFQYQGAWVERHFNTVERPHFNGRAAGVEILGEKVRGSVIREVPFYIQHLEEETCCEFHPGGVNATLPPKDEPIIVHVEMTPAQKRLYKQADDPQRIMIWVKQLEEGANDWGGEQGVVRVSDQAERLRLMQISLAEPAVTEEGRLHFPEGAKSSVATAVIEIVEDNIEEDDPFIVYTHSKAFAGLLYKRMQGISGLRPALWTGDVKQADREQIKKAFGREKGPNVLVATIPSIAEGVDGLQRVCRSEIWASEDDNNMLNKQCRGRLRRTGQTRRNRSWYVLVQDTLGEKAFEARRKRARSLELSLRAQR